ncbi:hypothetical protein Nepgr_005715 [Nepenthes gracilis]|uniref:DUF1666 family protein n=1 Tax=Nepenthes gracilis TaxID=150966 RepID=A0AAD3S439_NEPGR|nr:hypothetical protein Nepgr_005715 [Nepenthes gracilis]
MDFFKVRKFKKAHKPNPENDSEDKPVPPPEELNNEKGHFAGKSVVVDVQELDDEDEDFITNEVKRRLKELRKNSFMMLIPEESGLEDEEEGEGETCSSEETDTGAQVQHVYYDSDSIYEKYREQMLFFDRMSAQQLSEVGSRHPYNPSPRATSKKPLSSFRCFYVKKTEEPEDETERLQKLDNCPYQDLERAYVAHICLTWEVLHCQYTQLSQKISCQPENPTCYNDSAQQYQQFQVLLQRFIENEPYEQGLRPEVYARTRYSLPKLLQVPNVQGSCRNAVEGDDADFLVLAQDLIKVIESSILTFHIFLKMDKKRPHGVINLYGSQNQIASPLQQVQSVVEKKHLKLKDLVKKKKGWKNKSWPATHEEVELLLGLIDIKVVSTVLRMATITKEQLLWCEDKMKKLDLSKGKLQRDPSPILFPC